VKGSCAACEDAEVPADLENDAPKTGGIADKASRMACPHYQQMQCLLDISEKACEPDEEPLPLLDYEAVEGVWLCCCPEPYKPCAKEEMNEVCMGAVGHHLSKDKVKSRSDMVVALQKARGDMLRAGEEACLALAAEEPLSVCGFEGSPPQKRSLLRRDLFCEMVTWQWEELGDGNAKEFKANGCTFDKGARAPSSKSSTRKGGALKEAKEEL